MASSALAFEHVSKEYRATFATNLREDLRRGLGRLAGRHSPRPVITALDDVSFAVHPGESYALVGHNGAGKTTALKLATRVTYPTRGRLRVRGRIGALIEVGTGLHPELNGRENIHLYGSFMGLSHSDIDARFDQIVEFSGLEHALAQPLKQYSSGMQLRLGFSIAAFLEPDVLLVDEAIAVGDAAFQAKCVQRMQDLTCEGRTLVFVSHDMWAVEALCGRTLWLSQGRVVDEGPTATVLKSYLMSVHDERMLADPTVGVLSGELLDIRAVTLHDGDGALLERARSDEPVVFRIQYHAKRRLVRPGFSIGISTGGMNCLTVASMAADGHGTPDAIEGEGVIACRFDRLPLQPQAYELWIAVRTADGYTDYISWQRLRMFRVEGEIEGTGPQALTLSLTDAPVRLAHSWAAD